jgi:hypothetical protein
LLRWADYLVLAHKPMGKIQEQIQASGLPTLDLLRGGFEPAARRGHALSAAL